MKWSIIAVIIAGCGHSASEPSDRIAKLESRLDKVTAALDQALGPPPPDPDKTYAVPITDEDPIEGPRDAKVTIVEGFDFLCPYCFLADPLVQQIRDKYPNDVRVVAKYLVVHGAPAASAGAYACAAAKQGKYSEMRQAMWSRLFTLEAGQPHAHADQIASLDAIASSVGVDPGKAAGDAQSCKKWIDESQRDLAAFGVHATPAFFVNGRPLRDRSFDGFDKLVTQELAKANHSDVAAADYYAKEIVGKGLHHVAGRFD
ncbi:MAG TPA: thioredoxin domain-containing protein [Kofleriaceae bacterium]|jgi:protein-disulfide isomerase|nr:thioredoxin domain-containing protein [Kofleriaceae bacterium]